MNLNQKGKTAILIFANSAQEEVKHKAIFKGRELFKKLTNNTLNTVEKSGLPYYHLSEKQQIGTTFGERFTNAIQVIFDKGYEEIITIGNDAPKLKSGHIVKAARELQDKKIVIGPSLDGGFYLLGISKSQFNSEQFVHLPWQTNKIKKSILNLLAPTKETQVTLLPLLTDIDSLHDIHQLLKDIATLPFKIKVIFLLILQKFRTINTTNPILFNFIQNLTFFNKGSPFS